MPRNHHPNEISLYEHSRHVYLTPPITFTTTQWVSEGALPHNYSHSKALTTEERRKEEGRKGGGEGNDMK